VYRAFVHVQKNMNFREGDKENKIIASQSERLVFI
jgi:hypothetical protein